MDFEPGLLMPRSPEKSSVLSLCILLLWPGKQPDSITDSLDGSTLFMHLSILYATEVHFRITRTAEVSCFFFGHPFPWSSTWSSLHKFSSSFFFGPCFHSCVRPGVTHRLYNLNKKLVAVWLYWRNTVSLIHYCHFLKVAAYIIFLIHNGSNCLCYLYLWNKYNCNFY